MSGLMEPVSVLPAQYFGSQRIQTAEQGLMVAVLLDAFKCIEDNRFATDSRSRRLFREAEEWFFARETDWPFSFAGICSVLDLDIDAIRQRLGAPQRESTPAGATRRASA